MKKTNKRWAIVALIVFLISMVALPQSQVNAAGTGSIKSVSITYPEGQTSATAFADTFSLQFALDMPKMAKGEQVHVNLEQPNALGYNQASFDIGSAFQVTPDGTGFTLAALQDTGAQLVQVELPVNYTENVSGTETIPLSVELNGQTTSVDMTIQEYKDKVDTNELVKKVPLGFAANGNLQWVAYYNYNQWDVTGSEDYPYVFEDIVGPNQVLVKDSISAYQVAEPITADGSRNLSHDGYDFDMSHFLQTQATDTGWHYENPSFQGFPTLAGGTLPTTSSFYIIYETQITDDGSSLYTNELYAQGEINGSGSEPIRVQGESPAQYQSAGQGSGDSDNQVGSLVFEKVDSADSSAKLAGAEFSLTDQATSEVYATITTDDMGKGNLGDIPLGDYTLQETKAPTGYELSDKTYPVSITTDQQVVDLGQITNDKTPPPVEPTGSLSFEKVDSADPTFTLAGAEFTLTDQATNQVYATITSDDTGKGVLGDIPLGEYTLQETKAPTGYELSDKIYPVSITTDQQVVDLGQITNDKTPPPVEPTGSLSFEKVDGADSSMTLAGAEFTLTDQATNQVYATITTDDSGMGNLEGIPVGDYTLQETKAPAGYELSDKTYPVAITADQQVVDLGQITNDKTPPPVEPTGSLTFEKVDSADAALKLSGAEFTLIDKATKEVYATITSDSNGIGSLEGIPVGDYTLQETKAPAGYELANKTFSVTISSDQLSVDLGDIPNAKVPTTPDQPTTPDEPNVPDKPTTPETPNQPQTPTLPTQLEVPEAPGIVKSTQSPVVMAADNQAPALEVLPAQTAKPLPKTGDSSSAVAVLIGVLLLLALGGYGVYRHTHKKQPMH
ncbi:LPXTG cell wall anchor domain-containing protein [Listeria booriae]|uniref:SpaA isopeptide-forming pilin-related protein n=1 Tax=Listeria booriae TaxID=1552123 RepID=UPI001623A520|nr:SpaA isopeptide-forming pilin-related protein [Listeria booriae]MBC1914191.1 LPXTG cell wall anchor domain-containing protein [Listeria booriae]